MQILGQQPGKHVKHAAAGPLALHALLYIHLQLACATSY
jgi:hypothetical protein